MLSERRCAQIGLASACLVLVTTIGVLFQGNLGGPVVQTINGLGTVDGDTTNRAADQAGDAVRTAMAK